MLDAECYQHIKPPDPLSEPRVLSHNETTATTKYVPTTSFVTQGESINENQHINGEVRYVVFITAKEVLGCIMSFPLSVQLSVQL